jgi:hypothetical protein
MYAFSLSSEYTCTFLMHLGVLVGDFAAEVGSELAYFASRVTGRRHQRVPTKPTFGQAFGVEGYVQVGGEASGEVYAPYAASMSSGDDIRLVPYKPSALDLSHVRSPEQFDAYKPAGSPLAA